MTDSAASSDALAVEYRTVGSLKPDPRNARTHPKRQLEQIDGLDQGVRLRQPRS